MTFDLGVIKRQRSKQNQVFGGNLTTVTVSSGDYRVHTFTTSGQLVFFAPASVEILVVGGGGAGTVQAGGAGGGGVVLSTANLLPGTYTITVGAGGINGNNGSNTVFAGPNINLTALGGGGAEGNPPGSGGSGAGGVRPYYGGGRPVGGTPGLGLQPTSIWGGYGNNGGYSGGGTGTSAAHGGGGGAGAVGGPGGIGGAFGGTGGIGFATDMSGTVQYYGGGGAGWGFITTGPNGLGGGPNSYGGGGNSNLFGWQNGGSGIVILRYRNF